MTIDSLEKCVDSLDALPAIALALIDISGFSSSVWSVCAQLRSRQIPFLILLPRKNPTLQQQSFSQGAQAVLVKPTDPRELLTIIQRLLTRPL